MIGEIILTAVYIGSIIGLLFRIQSLEKKESEAYVKML
jgi:hypothetical protein